MALSKITSESILDGEITTNKLGDLQVTSGKLASGAVPDEITKSSSNPSATDNPAAGVGSLHMNTTTGQL